MTFGWSQNSAQDDNYKLAESVLNKALTKQSSHTDTNIPSTPIKDESHAISVAEAALFKVYGQKHITDQKPYHIYNINKYWVMFGTLHYSKGGTFYIVIDAKNSKVIEIYHEK